MQFVVKKGEKMSDSKKCSDEEYNLTLKSILKIEELFPKNGEFDSRVNY